MAETKASVAEDRALVESIIWEIEWGTDPNEPPQWACTWEEAQGHAAMDADMARAVFRVQHAAARILAVLRSPFEERARDAVIRYSEDWAAKWERIVAASGTGGEWTEGLRYCAENLRSNAETLREEALRAASPVPSLLDSEVANQPGPGASFADALLPDPTERRLAPAPSDDPEEHGPWAVPAKCLHAEIAADRHVET